MPALDQGVGVMLLVAAVVVMVVSALAGLVGLALHGRLRPYHLHSRSKEAVRLIQGLVAAIAALVRGLLVASAATHRRAREDGLAELAAELLELDTALAQFGPGAAPARGALHAMVESALAEDAWASRPGNFAANGPRVAAFREEVLRLEPIHAL